VAQLKALGDETKKSALAAGQQLTKLRAQSGVATPASAAAKKAASDKALAALEAQVVTARASLASIPAAATQADPTSPSAASNGVATKCGAALKFEVPAGPAERKLVTDAEGEQALSDPDADIKLARVELNGDGVPDLIISYDGNDYCGTAGCSISVHLSDHGRFVAALNVTAYGIEVAETSTRGVCDLVLNGDPLWAWDGQTYDVLGCACPRTSRVRRSTSCCESE
jgi:hypothetical protein